MNVPCCHARRCRIAIALLAQFYPKKYPENWQLLLVCLVLYGMGSAALSAFTALVEDDCFLITRPRKVRGACMHGAGGGAPHLPHAWLGSCNKQLCACGVRCRLQVGWR